MTPPAPAPRRVGLFDVLVVLLAVLLFVWGFLDWWGYSGSADPQGARTFGMAANGYRLTTAYPIVALGLAATVIALAGGPVRSRVLGLAATVAFLGALFAVLALVVKPSLVSAFYDDYSSSSDIVSRSSVKIGLILTVATAVAQFVVFLAAWLAAIGRLSVGRLRGAAPAYPQPPYPAYQEPSYDPGYPASAYPVSAYPEAPYPEAPYPEAPYPEAPYPAAPYPAAPYPAAPYPAQPYPTDSYSPAPVQTWVPGQPYQYEPPPTPGPPSAY